MTRPDAFVTSRALARRHGKTYYLASTLLPADSRLGIWAIYGFCRTADDVVDGPGTPAWKAAQLDDLERSLDAALRRGQSSDPVLDALVNTYRRWDIPLETLDRFLRAMRMDLTTTHYDTWYDLLRYMEGSAAVIGEMVLPVLGGPPQAREPARAPGLAFQPTNFIRDVDEDLARGRTYLPLEDLERVGALEALRARRFDPSVAALIRVEVARNLDLYEASLAGDALLNAPARRCVRLARELYSAILLEIASRGYNVFAGRAVVPPRRRLSAVLATLVRPRALPRALRVLARAHPDQRSSASASSDGVTAGFS